LQDALAELLTLPEQEKEARGLADTPREIDHQPATWEGTLRRLSAQHGEIAAFLDECGIAVDSDDPPCVLLAGAGTSDYIGRAVSRLLRRHWRCQVDVVPSTELLTNMDDFILPGKRYLCISFSRSAESSEGVAVLEQMLERYPVQVRHMLVTCNGSGAMATFPGIFAITLDDAVNDRGLAMTSSFTNMVIAGQYLAYIREPHRYAPLLHELAEMGSRLLPQAANKAAELAAKGFSRVCFLGTGAMQAVAEESALKVLELNAGRIATLAQSPLGLRHGPLSFLNSETLVVAHLSGDESRAAYELDLLEDIRGKQLGVQMLVIAPKSSSRLRSLTSHILPLDAPLSFPDACRLPVDVMAGQLLALFFSLANGITPDSPSQGAISRVVSHVKIYSAAERK
jgi:tagatose-6-phosphate ketose/aldose isomerase